MSRSMPATPPTSSARPRSRTSCGCAASIAGKQGWTVVDSYHDRAVSGARSPASRRCSPTRCAGRFDVVLAEALDRISRDQEDVAGVFKRMAFAGVKIITLSEGEIAHLHVGLKGTMNALFLKDLADKTRRGLRGRVEAGKAGGGLCYGYESSSARCRWRADPRRAPDQRGRS